MGGICNGNGMSTVCTGFDAGVEKWVALEMTGENQILRDAQDDKDLSSGWLLSGFDNFFCIALVLSMIHRPRLVYKLFILNNLRVTRQFAGNLRLDG